MNPDDILGQSCYLISEMPNETNKTPREHGKRVLKELFSEKNYEKHAVNLCSKLSVILFRVQKRLQIFSCESFVRKNVFRFRCVPHLQNQLFITEFKSHRD